MYIVDFLFERYFRETCKCPVKKKEVSFNHAHREMMFEEYLYLIFSLIHNTRTRLLLNCNILHIHKEN